MGDPRIILTEYGSRLQFIGGQPLMDGGLENIVIISLFTNEEWCGNALMKRPIGSAFVQACDAPITLQSLNRVRLTALAALNIPALGAVTVDVTNTTGLDLNISVMIEPPGGTPQEVMLSRSAGAWMAQALNPAYRKIRPLGPSFPTWAPPPPPANYMTFENGDPMTFEDGSPLEFIS